MGNRITGFLTGVLVTGAVTVATAGRMYGIQAANQIRIHEVNDSINQRILSVSSDHTAADPINRRAVVVRRPSVAETCKDIWNDEIIKMTNRIYAINWYQWGLEADKKLNKLTDKVAGLAFEKK